ncbi:TIR-like protein FxsC [Streptomyces griseorubiginosus]|uniref:TIR-like protein FxsC n=1 Tax=Streptomyces griseorubiginosus TaxID=67304 RepID=UPI00331D0BA3
MVEVFLSYSGQDDESKLVTDFFGDLCEELGRITTLDANQIGYQYTQMRAAMEWRKVLTEALGTCKVFVPLLSPRFFASEFCGKEWWVFTERQRLYTESTPGAQQPQCILPVMWESCALNGDSAVPKAAAGIWMNDPTFGEVYAERGLRQIVQLKKKYDTEYRELVIALGRRVADLIQGSKLPNYKVPEDTDLLCNAFAMADIEIDGAEADVPQVAKHEPSGPRHVTLAVASSTRDEISAVRQNTAGYGSRPDDWAPYHPDAPDPVVGYAIDVARELNLIPYPKPFNDEMQKLLDSTEEENQLAVIILDPWTTKLESRRKALEEYDKRLSYNVGLVIPHSMTDDETKAHANSLHDDLTELLKRHTRAQQSTLLYPLETVITFKEGVRQVLVELTRMVLNELTPTRSVTGHPFVQRPVLDGPGEE